MKLGRIQLQSMRWEPVNTPDGDFEVQIKRPTAGERYRETAYALAHGKDLKLVIDCEEMQSRYRVAVAVTDWRGLEDADGKAIPFSIEALDALCSSYPLIFHTISILATRAFRLGWDAESDPEATQEEKADAPGN